MQHSSNMFIAVAIFLTLLFANMLWADWQQRRKTESLRDKWERINRKK